MSNVYLINYDLNNAKNYDSLFEQLEKLGAKRVLKSCWILQSNLTAYAIFDIIRPILDNDDGLFVTKLARQSKRVNVEANKEWLQKVLESA